MPLRTRVAAVLLAGILSLSACASQDDDGGDQIVWEVTDPSESYPLATCPVSGKPLDETRIAIDYGGEEVQLHCQNDLDIFLADPDSALAKVRAARAR